MRNTKITNVKSHIEIKRINIHVNFKVNFTAATKLFPIDDSSAMIGHLLD